MNTSLPEPFYRGKVRDLFDAPDDTMIIVATDRVSAFDVVFPDPIPNKGAMLTRISNLWFDAMAASGFMREHDFRSHLVATNVDEFPAGMRHEAWRDRAVHVRRVERIDFVVRGACLCVCCGMVCM